LRPKSSLLGETMFPQCPLLRVLTAGRYHCSRPTSWAPRRKAVRTGRLR
jgi:hypothetical protein